MIENHDKEIQKQTMVGESSGAEKNNTKKETDIAVNPILPDVINP